METLSNDSRSLLTTIKNKKKVNMSNLIVRNFPNIGIKQQLTTMKTYMKSCGDVKTIPTLIFPANNSEELSKYYLNTPNSQKTYSPFITSQNSLTHNNSKSTRVRPHFLYRNTEPSKLSYDKKKFPIEKNVRKSINLIDFGNRLKLYDTGEKVHKEIIRKRLHQLDEIYFDYDRRNDKIKMNSFSGNGADLLKRKICFVKGVMDYLYPKLVLNKYQYLNRVKEKEFLNEMKKLKEYKNAKYYLINHQTAAQNSRLSKYEHGGAFYNEAIKLRGDCIKMKKSFINNRTVYKYIKNYDFK